MRNVLCIIEYIVLAVLPSAAYTIAAERIAMYLPYLFTARLLMKTIYILCDHAIELPFLNNTPVLNNAYSL